MQGGRMRIPRTFARPALLVPGRGEGKGCERLNSKRACGGARSRASGGHAGAVRRRRGGGNACERGAGGSRGATAAGRAEPAACKNAGCLPRPLLLPTSTPMDSLPHSLARSLMRTGHNSATTLTPFVHFMPLGKWERCLHFTKPSSLRSSSHQRVVELAWTSAPERGPGQQL